MNRNTSNVMVALLLGAAAGGAAALLLAPASGADTRKKIKDTLRRAKDKALEGVEGARGFAEVRKGAMKEAILGGKEAYQKAVKKGPAEVST